MNTGPLTRRILKTFHAATPMQVVDGMNWYRNAWNVAQDIAAGTTHPAENIAAVIAVLSPGITWDQNKTAARNLVEHHAAGRRTKVGLYPQNSEKAYDILTTNTPNVTGPKVSAFFANILGDTEQVTIDRHAYRIAMGKDLPKKNDGKIPVRVHRTIAQAYKNAARIVGVEPSEMQAITWTVYRGRAD